MGKESVKGKQLARSASNVKQGKGSGSGAGGGVGELNSPRAFVFDKDNAIFIAMSHELRDEGNKLFQRRDYEGAILKYEKAIKLLPRNHIDVSSLRSNMAACFMQMGLSEYPRAIHECNLALEVTPKYSKALLKRARCYEALNRLDLALRDVNTVLNMEPNNIMAIEIAERVNETIEERGIGEDDTDLPPIPEYVEPPIASSFTRVLRDRVRRKRNNRTQENKAYSEDGGSKIAIQIEDERPEVSQNAIQMEDKKPEPSKNAIGTEDKKPELSKIAVKVDEKKLELKVAATNKIDEAEDKIDEKKAEDKLVVEEKIASTAEKGPQRTVKLVFGEDIRCAQIPVSCNILKLREAIGDRFPGLKAVLIKYRDQEGDLITITTTEELRWAEAAADHGSLRLYLVEVNPEHDPFYEKVKKEKEVREVGLKKHKKVENGNLGRNVELLKRPACMEDWIIQFAYLFKNYVGFDPDSYLDLHDLGMKLYSEGLEDAVTSEEAQDYFAMAGDKFQEMAALALFNWGNVHMSRARKRVSLTDDASRESVLEQVKVAYDWAQKEYSEAGEKYEEALHIMPNFYEGILALGQQQFDQAKLAWYYAMGTNVDLELWPSAEVLDLYNKAELNMERGMLVWEEAEEQRLDKLLRPNKVKGTLQKMNLIDLVKDLSDDESSEQAATMKSQINVLWGTMLYERSIMEFKLGLPVWQECLEAAMEKFERAGAPSTDIAVMMKNHPSNDAALEGWGFNIDEIVQAWNEMYEAKRWQCGIPSFRLEPLLRRRVSKLYYALEQT